MKKKKQNVGEQIIKGLKEFENKLKNNTPIEGIRIKKINTPDGTAHVKEHIVINQKTE